MTPKPLLVGEDNPLSLDPEYALWPDPPGCAGWRLCHPILGLEERQYLRVFDRTNLCSGKWNLRVARDTAHRLAAERTGLFILLGAKVRDAFGFAGQPFFTTCLPVNSDNTYIILPHPSGRNLIWNDRSHAERARGLLRGRGVEL